jgi:hypothetical protein
MLTTSYIVLICSLRIEYVDMCHVNSVLKVSIGFVTLAGPDNDRDEPTNLFVPGAGPDGYRDEPANLVGNAEGACW